MKIRSVTLIVASCLVPLATSWSQQIAVVVDPPPVTRIMDDFNDGVDTSTGYSNASAGGEAAGVVSVVVAENVPDPQVQFPNSGDPFDIAVYPFFRLASRSTFGGAGQVFPLPPSGVTVVGFQAGANFSEAQLTFITDPPGADGTGLRVDPVPTGGAAPDTFEYDYVMLDKFQTIGLAEYDRDAGAEGFDIIGNGHITNVQVSAASSSLSATTNGNDPIMQRTGLSVDASIYTVLEIRAAFDPLSNSRFEVFWGTDVNPGPAGGQSLVITDQLIRDGEMHTYRCQMSDDTRWANTLQVLRVDPLADADSEAGRTFEIDYVRLIAAAPVLDSDGDGLPDAVETGTGVFVDGCDTGTDSGDADTDGDGFNDGLEVRSGTDPNDINSTPGASLDGYASSPVVYGLGAAIAPNSPIIGFGSPTGFAVSPALPDGLVLDPSTGVITGTPVAITAAADYTITASFAGSPDSTFDLGIEIANPFIENYSLNPAVYQRGADIGANTPLLNGAAPDMFSVNPPLPDGLALDPNSGSITGIPSGFQDAADYVITASYNGFPDSLFTVSITVEASPVLVVDPAQPITNFVPLGEFNTDGDIELWNNNNTTLTAAGGLLVASTTGPDPQVFKDGLDLDTSDGEHTVLEFRLRQPDTDLVEFFWADGNGGLSAARRFALGPGDIPGDGDFHIYQIDMTGVFSGAVNVIRLDPGGAGGRTVEFDYIRLGNLTASEPPRFTAINYDSDLDEATFTWTSSPGESFVIEFSTDLSIWTELDDGFPAAAVGETTSFLDVNAGASTRKYYRVSRVAN